MKVVSIEGDRAKVEMGGVVREVGLALVEGVHVGDYVIVHAGFAIEKLNEEEAAKTLELLNELARAAQQEEAELEGQGAD